MFELIKIDHQAKTNQIIGSFLSNRAAQAYMEEVIMDACYLYQGSVEPLYVRTKYERTGYWNASSFVYPKSYGFVVQTCEDYNVFSCWWRNRTVGIFTNSWVDEKLFTLIIVEKLGNKIPIIYDGLYNITNIQKLPKRCYIDELKSKKLPCE